ncbi:MAG: LuxR C-terminal-related transcriptional regulator [Arcicella sp.]|nr:LuxR C-terminal-related transcriptional regulator [Arcicella sp.]
MNHETLILQSQTIWTEICKNQADDVGKTKIDTEYLEIIAQNTKRVIVIINAKSYSKIYLSKNVKELFGYTEEDISTGLLQYIKFITFDHASFPVIAGRWYVKYLGAVPFEEKINQQIVLVGTKLKTRGGKIIRTLIQTGHLEEDENRNPIKIINSIQDISHFVKDDFWWMRFTYGDAPQKVKYYHSDIGKSSDNDILSEREKEILRLIYEGIDSPEIADRLNLSIATVHTHRRNMLNRTGLKDTTALLQIAMSIGMI